MGQHTMGLFELIIIAVGAVAVFFLVITVVRRISAYYRQRHNMSIWAGVFLLTIAVAMITYSSYHYNSPNIPLIVFAGVLLILTGGLDIRHAGLGMGLLALLIQIVLSTIFIALIVVMLLFLIIRAIRRRDRLFAGTIFRSASAFRSEADLFFHFFLP